MGRASLLPHQWVSQPGAGNWFTKPCMTSTTSGDSIQDLRIIPKLVSPPEAKGFRVLAMTMKRVSHLMGLTKFVYDTKLGGASDSSEGRGALQRDLEIVKGWATTSHLGWGNPGHTVQRGE